MLENTKMKGICVRRRTGGGGEGDIYIMASVSVIFLAPRFHELNKLYFTFNNFRFVSTSARSWVSCTWARFHLLYFLMFLPVRACGFHVPELSFTSYISWCFCQCAVVDFMYLSALSLPIFLDFSTSARGCGFHVPALSFSSYISWFFYQCAVEDFIRLSPLTHFILCKIFHQCIWETLFLPMCGK